MDAEQFMVTPQSVITPVPRPNRGDIRDIPLGAVMLVATLGGEGVEFAGYTWVEGIRDGWLNGLPDEEASYDNTSVFYIAPDKLAVDNLPIRVELDIVDEAMQELHDLPNLSIAKVRRVLGKVVRDSREGMTVNPF